MWWIVTSLLKISKAAKGKRIFFFLLSVTEGLNSHLMNEEEEYTWAPHLGLHEQKPLLWSSRWKHRDLQQHAKTALLSEQLKKTELCQFEGQESLFYPCSQPSTSLHDLGMQKTTNALTGLNFEGGAFIHRLILRGGTCLWLPVLVAAPATPTGFLLSDEP